MGLSYKSHGMVDISIREEESVGVVTKAKGNNKYYKQVAIKALICGVIGSVS